MWASISYLFNTDGFPPRSECGTAWINEPALMYVHIASDVATFLAYLAVPCVVAYFIIGRAHIKLPRLFWLFLGLVFISCGLVHLIESAIFYWPIYRLSAVVKVVTALVSCIGVVVLVRLMPRMLSLKSPDELAREIHERKQAESHLENERYLLHTLLNHLPDLIYFKDTDGKFTRISRSLATNLCLRDRTEAIGKSDEDFFTLDYADQARQDEQELLRTGEPLVSKEENPTWPNGESQWLLTTKIPLLDVYDRATGLCGISHDITKQKQIEQALRASEERFELAVRGSSDGIWDWNVATGEVYYSPRFKQLLGFADREFPNVFSAFESRLHPSDLKKTMTAVEEHLESNKPYDVEYRLKTKSGDYRWFRARGQALWDHAGKPFRMAGSITDITEHKAAQKSLQERTHIAALAAEVGMALTRNLELDETLQEIVEAMVQHLQAAFARIWLLNEADNCLHLRASAGMYTHLDGAHSRIPVGPDYKIGWIAAEGKPHLTNQVIGDPHIHDQEWAKREDMVAFAGYPLRVDNHLIGVVAMFARHPLPIETTNSLASVANGIAIGVKRKQTQFALQKAKEAAEAANRAKSDFLANMSHEIRTPMNAVIGLTELVLGTTLTPLQRDYLTTVLESAESLLVLINQVLDFSKIEAGKFELEIAPFRLRDNLGDAMKALGLRAHKKNVELIYDIASDVPDRLIGDEGRLRQIVVNLVGNAIKFTDEGEVVVKVECKSCDEEATELHMSVSDTGIGIPQDKIATIFDAFEQGDASTTRRYGGTGLGLAIASQLVQQMAGEIWVKSEIGRGSTFHFTALFGVESGDPSPAADISLLEGIAVLVVDDNETNRHILREVLASWRLEAITAENAGEAMNILLQRQEAGKPIECVLTDVQMPDMDGFMLTEQIRKNKQLHDPIVIMLTSGSHGDDLQRAEQLGVAGHLLKPVKQSELLNAILDSMDKRSTTKKASIETPGATEETGNLRILLAEDGLANQKLAVGLLKKLGHTVVVANNGAEALAKLEQDMFDLILMDVQMPEMDGLEATRRIRERERETGDHLLIIALTARAMAQDREQCLEAGMDDYLSKPFRQDELKLVLKRVFAE